MELETTSGKIMIESEHVVNIRRPKQRFSEPVKFGGRWQGRTAWRSSTRYGNGHNVSELSTWRRQTDQQGNCAAAHQSGTCPTSRDVTLAGFEWRFEATGATRYKAHGARLMPEDKDASESKPGIYTRAATKSRDQAVVLPFASSGVQYPCRPHCPSRCQYDSAPHHLLASSPPRCSRRPCKRTCVGKEHPPPANHPTCRPPA